MKKFDKISNQLDAVCLLDAAYDESILSVKTNENLKRAVPLAMRGSILSGFSLSFELAWKFFKSMLTFDGLSGEHLGSPRDVVKAFYANYDYIDEPTWLSMLKDRNVVTNVYDETEADELADRIRSSYLPAMVALRDRIRTEREDLLAHP